MSVPAGGGAGAPHVDVPAEAPLRRPIPPSNRLLGSGVALVGAVLFALLLGSGGVLLVALARPGDGTRAWAEAYLASPVLAVPTLLFLAGFLVLVGIADRSGWWAYIIGGLVIAGVVYGGSIAVLLVLRGGLQMSLQGAATEAVQLATNPGLVLAGLLARELVLWLGLGISRSGARAVRRHRAAVEEFERRLAVGAPSAHRDVPRESVDGSSGPPGSI